MAMTQIPVVPANYESDTPILQTTAADNTNGMYFVNNGLTVFYVNNASMAAVTVGVVSVPDSAGRGGNACDNLSVSVPAGDVYMFGPFTPAWWNQIDGTVQVTFDAGTDISVYGIQIA
jgi:hypothetical protein